MKAAGALIGILWLLGAQSGGDAKSLGKVLIEGERPIAAAPRASWSGWARAAPRRSLI